MANTNLTNQRQVFVEEYVRSGDHLEAAKKAGYKDTHTLRNQASTLRMMFFLPRLWIVTRLCSISMNQVEKLT